MAGQIMQARRMKTDISVTSEERARLANLIADRNTPAKVIWRAHIVLLSADGETVKAICRATGKSKPCVWRWQRRNTSSRGWPTADHVGGFRGYLDGLAYVTHVESRT